MIKLIENRLLATLPPEATAALLPHCERVSLRAGDVLYQPGRPAAHVWFPSSVFVSLEFRGRGGSIAELAVVGNDGLVGVPAMLGAAPTHHAVVHSAGQAIRLPVDVLKREQQSTAAVRAISDAYTHVLLIQVAQTSACKTLHPLTSRLCRWLLVCADRLNSADVPATQDQVARLLGVRRESVNHVTSALQSDGCLRICRGHMQIVDSGRLEAFACECLNVIRSAHAGIAPPTLLYFGTSPDRQNRFTSAAETSTRGLQHG